MKAKRIEDGKIVDVEYCGTHEIFDPVERIYIDEKTYKDSEDNEYYENELFFVNDENIDWEQRRFDLAKAAMQGLCASGKHHYQTSAGIYDGTLSDLAIRIADTMIEKLKQ